MKIEDQIGYYFAKIKLNNLFPKRLNSKKEMDAFNDLLHEITEYEIDKGMIYVCNSFYPDDKTSSETICKNCGEEKYLHNN